MFQRAAIFSLNILKQVMLCPEYKPSKHDNLSGVGKEKSNTYPYTGNDRYSGKNGQGFLFHYCGRFHYRGRLVLSWNAEYIFTVVL